MIGKNVLLNQQPTICGIDHQKMCVQCNKTSEMGPSSQSLLKTAMIISPPIAPNGFTFSFSFCPFQFSVVYFFSRIYNKFIRTVLRITHWKNKCDHTLSVLEEIVVVSAAGP